MRQSQWSVMAIVWVLGCMGGAAPQTPSATPEENAQAQAPWLSHKSAAS